MSPIVSGLEKAVITNGFSKNHHAMHLKYRPATRSLHPASRSSHFPFIPSIHMSTTFEHSESGKLEYENPTRRELQSYLSSLESAKFGVAFSSGLEALATISSSLLETGQHVLCCDDVYGGTNRFFSQCATLDGIETTFVEGVFVENWVNSFKVGKTKLVWIESPTNPTMKIIDIEAVAVALKKLDPECVIVVDNTFMTPVLQSPLKMGADIVIHSCTKYINGHSDVIMGAIMLNDDKLYERIFLNTPGNIPSPSDCYLVMRSILTLHARVERQTTSAMKIARFLEKHENVDRIFYPGLESHPQHQLAVKQYSGFGGMISIYVKEKEGGEAIKVVQAVKIFTTAVSLGCVCSLIQIPSLMTHSAVSSAHKSKLGLTDNLVRLSIGLEDVDDLIKDIDNALRVAFKPKLAGKEEVVATNGFSKNGNLPHHDNRLATRSLHAGSRSSHWTHSPVITPIYTTTTFENLDPGVSDYEYSRCDNPTRTELQSYLSSLESAKFGLAFGNGLGALTAISCLLKAGQHVLFCEEVKPETRKFFSECSTRKGIESTFVDGVVVENWVKHFKLGETKLVWIESPTNPSMKIIDIETVVAKVKDLDSECIVVVDNTFMTPIFQSPLELGADIVVHSGDNYISGHSDFTMGAIMLNDDKLYARLKFFQNARGNTLSPYNCYLAIRSIKTLHLRVEKQATSAMKIARFLEKHEHVDSIIYPGLESHPQHKLAVKQFTGFGGTMSIYVKEKEGGETFKVAQGVKIFATTASLGYVCSLIQIPALSDARKANLGLNNNLLRLSIGLEDVDDLIEDIDQALKIAFS